MAAHHRLIDRRRRRTRQSEAQYSRMRSRWRWSGSGARPAKEIVDCFRLDPSRSDSPYVPAKVGIYAAAAHLGWFQDTFKAAYPAGHAGHGEVVVALAPVGVDHVLEQLARGAAVDGRARALPGWLREGIEIEPETPAETSDSADPQEPKVLDEEPPPP